MAACRRPLGPQKRPRNKFRLPGLQANVSRPGKLQALTFAVIITGTLAGCAAYRKCGLSGCAGDAKITTAVEALLDQHPALGPPDMIRVQTLDRVVYLTGQVSTGLQRQIAESVALQAPGVARVVNSIAETYEGR
jgi:osmotically-inducible protein OsmY